MIGFIGLGVMGEPMCRNMASKSDEQLLGYDIDPAPLARLKQQGVQAAASVQEIAERCSTVFLSLSSRHSRRARPTASRRRASR